jgi:hypothetical protein
MFFVLMIASFSILAAYFSGDDYANGTFKVTQIEDPVYSFTTSASWPLFWVTGTALSLLATLFGGLNWGPFIVQVLFSSIAFLLGWLATKRKLNRAKHSE